MKRCLVLVFCIVLSLGMVSLAQAATVIGFEDLAVGTYSSISYADVIFSYQGSSSTNVLNVQSSAPGPPLSGQVIIGSNTYQDDEWYRAEFAPSVLVHNVSVDLGDYNADLDFLILNAFDSANNLLMSRQIGNPASVYGGLTLSVSSVTPIAYVLFNEVNSPYASQFQGSIYFDNFTYDSQAQVPVPEPGSMMLLGSGLIGLAAYGRKRFRG